MQVTQKREIELWLRPWALVDLKRRHRRPLASGSTAIVDRNRAGLWLYVPEGTRAGPAGLTKLGEPVSGFSTDNGRTLLVLPLPLRHSTGLTAPTATGTTKLSWHSAPERPSRNHDPQTAGEEAARRLMLRAEAVWDRLRDVETALADPANLWEELRKRWTEEDNDVPPRMDLIVHHATALSRTLDELDRTPRRILRRTNQQVPISRVQELDRRAMTWLVRQPGETLAERAGDRQRLLAVTREENFDTLENRVLRAYAELARHVARNYLDRNRTKALSNRARKVKDFERRCKRLAHDLADRGVRLAEAGVTPNFVLQHNPRYHAIWEGWQELLKHDRIFDELWQWQARSWEEFCTLAVMVALVSVPGARLIASAPLSFLDEQRRGTWTDHDNPLGVFHLPSSGIVVEVRYRMANPDVRLRDFGAPIWVRIGRVGDAQAFLTNLAIWPVWDIEGGLVEGEISEVSDLLPFGRKAQLAAGIVLRPAAAGKEAEIMEGNGVLTATMGTDGSALSEGVAAVRNFLTSVIQAKAG